MKSKIPDTGIIVTMQEGDLLQKVLILEKVSRSTLLVQDINRGKGWDEDRRKYMGVKVPSGWMRGQNYEYGRKFEIHKKLIISS